MYNCLSVTVRVNINSFPLKILFQNVKFIRFGKIHNLPNSAITDCVNQLILYVLGKSIKCIYLSTDVIRRNIFIAFNCIFCYIGLH